MTDVEQLRKEAQAYIDANKPQGFGFRSCWNCNAAHEHLKDAEYPILCFECGRWYFKGTDITESK